MGKRVSERLSVKLHSRLIAGSINCSGVVVNLSEKGVCLNIAPSDASIDIASGTTLKLEVRLPSGEMIIMPCVIVWIYKSPLKNTSYSAGLEIISPPAGFIEFYKKLSMEKEKMSV